MDRASAPRLFLKAARCAAPGATTRRYVRRPRPGMVQTPRCIAARDCLSACPEDALELTPAGMPDRPPACNLCGKCEQACRRRPSRPSAAPGPPRICWPCLLKDLVFYETSHGGVTFSGGEPMLQAIFLAEILPQCRRSGLHVALDTCGMAAWGNTRKCCLSSTWCCTI